MVSQIAFDAVQFYRSRGISKDAAVAIVSVLWYESKLKPGSQGSQSTETPGTLNPSGAYGIASWNGPRQAKLAEFAAKKSLNVGDLDTQLAFVLTEAANSYPQSWAAITSPLALGYAQIIPIFVAEYENPKDHQAEISGALAFAAQLYPAVPVSVPITPQPSGATTMPPIDPALISMLVKLLAPVAESLVAGLIKGIIQHATPAGSAATPVAGFDVAALAQLVAKELAALQGAKQ